MNESTSEFLSEMSDDTIRLIHRAIKNEKADVAIERAKLDWADVEDMYWNLIDLDLAHLESRVISERVRRNMG